MKRQLVPSKYQRAGLLTAFAFLLMCPAATSKATSTLSAEAKTSTAEVFIARNDWNKAATLLRKALADDPDYSKASQLMGYVLYKQGKTEEAISHLKHAADDPSCFKRDECLTFLAELLLDENRVSEAIPYLRKSISINSNDIDAYRALFDAYQKTGNMTESMKTGQQILQRFPKDPFTATLKKWMETIAPEQKTLTIATEGASSVDNYFLETTATSAACWDTKQMPIRVYIEPANKDSHWKSEYDTILKKAFQTWSTALKDLVTFEFVSSSSDAQIKCHWTSNSQELGGSFEQGVARTAQRDHQMQKADITILMVQTTNPKLAISDEIITKTCLHEIGHALGLQGHSPNPRDIMYFSESDKGLKQIGLTERDRKTIQMLYTQPLIARTTNPLLLESAKAKAYTFEEGLKFINREDFEGAISCFTYVLSKDSSSTTARINLGIAYTGLAMKRDEEKRITEAEEFYKQALQVRHQIPDRHMLDAAVKNYAAMLRELGRENDAKKVEEEL